MKRIKAPGDVAKDNEREAEKKNEKTEKPRTTKVG